MSDSPSTLISILGNEYRIRLVEGQEQLVGASARLLNRALGEAREHYPTLSGERLLVMAALNLCSRQVELQQQHDAQLQRFDAKVSATVERLAQALRSA